MSEFMQTLEKAAQSIRQEPQLVSNSDKPKNQHKTTIAVLAGVDLFMRFVTRNSHDFSVSRPFLPLGCS
jgi:translation initiation factor eIF-2B subunit alpha